MSNAAPTPARPRRALRRRARRALGLTFALVLGAHALGWALLQGVPRLRDPMYHQRADLLAARAKEQPDRPFVLVMLGSSRVQRGFAPRELEAPLSEAVGRRAVAFNFGVQGTGPLYHNLYVRRMLADGPRPDALYLEVTPSMLWDSNGVPSERRTGTLDARFLRWEELAVLDRFGAGWPTMRDEWRAARAKPLWEYRFQFVWNVLPAWVPPQYSVARGGPGDLCGWTPIEFVGDDEFRRAALANARREHGRAVSEPRTHPAPVAALRSTCELCRANGVPLALVLMPEGPSFRALYSPDAEAHHRAILDGIRADYGVPLFDARDWVAEDGFADGHHLLPGGARTFSARFASEVVLPRAPARRTDRAAR